MRFATKPAIAGVLVGVLGVALAPSPVAGQTMTGYWKRQGETLFFCTGPGGKAEPAASCRDANRPGGVHFEILDFADGRATFRESGIIGGGMNVVTWRGEWALPAIIVPGQIALFSTRGTVLSVSYGRPDYPRTFNVPSASFFPATPRDVIAGVGLVPAKASGQSQTLTNSTIRADFEPEGFTNDNKPEYVKIGRLDALNAWIPYVWVKGTPPREVAPPGFGAAPADGPANSSGAKLAAPAQRSAAAVVAPPESKRVFFNGNVGGVSNGGKSPEFVFDTAVRLTYLMTYHWNGGRGAPGGTLALVGSDGSVYGPWPVTVRAAAYWETAPNVVLPAGRYRLIDSDPSTWAQNAESGGFGMADLRGDRQ